MAILWCNLFIPLEAHLGSIEVTLRSTSDQLIDELISMSISGCISDDLNDCCCADQTLSNIPGVLVTTLGAALQQRTGSWRPVFYICGGVQLLSALIFGALAQVRYAHTRAAVVCD